MENKTIENHKFKVNYLFKFLFTFKNEFCNIIYFLPEMFYLYQLILKAPLKRIFSRSVIYDRSCRIKRGISFDERVSSCYRQTFKICTCIISLSTKGNLKRQSNLDKHVLWGYFLIITQSIKTITSALRISQKGFTENLKLINSYTFLW